MRRVIVRYRVKPDRVAENEELVRAVYAELAGVQPEGLRYATVKLDDGVTFVHVAVHERDNPCRGSRPSGRSRRARASAATTPRSSPRRPWSARIGSWSRGVLVGPSGRRPFRPQHRARRVNGGDETGWVGSGGGGLRRPFGGVCFLARYADSIAQTRSGRGCSQFASHIGVKCEHPLAREGPRVAITLVRWIH
jgi:hypothetical protein